jgi:hypothetical protein
MRKYTLPVKCVIQVFTCLRSKTAKNQSSPSLNLSFNLLQVDIGHTFQNLAEALTARRTLKATLKSIVSRFSGSTLPLDCQDGVTVVMLHSPGHRN